MKALKAAAIAAIAAAVIVGASVLAAENKSGGSSGTTPGALAGSSSGTSAGSSAASEQAALKTLESFGFVVEKVPAKVPGFELELLKGGKATLASYAGKLLVLNFWATWCPPCRAEMPALQKFRDALKGKGVELLAVSYREDAPTVKSFIAKNPYSFPIALDPSGAVGDRYVTVGIPTTVLIDGAGRLVATIVGGIEWDRPELVSAVAALAAE